MAARRDVGTDHNSGNPEDSSADHFFHLRLGKTVTVFDGVDASFERSGNAVVPDGVGGDLFPDAMSLVDNGLGFIVGEIDVTVQHAVGRVEVAVVGVILDPVRAMHHLLANRFAGLFDSVDILYAGRHLELPGVAEQRVHTGGSHGARGHLHVGAGNFAIVDGFLDVRIGVHGAFGLEIAQRRETVGERDLRIARGENGAIGDGLLQKLRVIVGVGDVALEQNVSMRVRKTGKNRGAREVNKVNARRRRPTRNDARNFVALDKNEGIGNWGITFAVDQAPGANSDALWRDGRRLLRLKERTPQEGWQGKQQDQQAAHSGHGGLHETRQRIRGTQEKERPAALSGRLALTGARGSGGQ